MKNYHFNFQTDLLSKNKKLIHSSSQPAFMKTFYQLNKNTNKNMNNNIIDKVNEGELKGTYKELSKIFEGHENNFNCINSPIVHKIRYIISSFNNF